MAREIVVPMAAAAAASRTPFPWIACAVILVVAVAIGNNGVTIPVERIWQLMPIVLLLPLLLLALTSIIFLTGLVFDNVKASGSNRETAVVVYPLGIQLVQRKTGSTKRVERVKFIAWDQVLDCVVVEHIKVWKVTSVVMIRLKSLSTSEEKDFALIEAFPGSAEMSYERCLDLRSRILNAFAAETSTLKRNQSISKSRKQKEISATCRN